MAGRLLAPLTGKRKEGTIPRSPSLSSPSPKSNPANPKSSSSSSSSSNSSRSPRKAAVVEMTARRTRRQTPKRWVQNEHHTCAS